MLFVIKEVMEEKGISLKILAKITRIKEKRLFEIINNALIPNDDEISAIAKALDSKITELYYTVKDYNRVREYMHDAIEEYGLNSIQTRKYSVILDKLMNIMYLN